MTGPDTRTGQLAFADLTLDPLTGRFTRGVRRGEFTRTEAKLLALFLANPGRVLSRRAVLWQVWRRPPQCATSSLDVYVSYVRRKTEAGGAVRLLHTVRGVGFVLCAPEDAQCDGGGSP